MKTGSNVTKILGNLLILWKLGHQYDNWVKCDQNSRQPTYLRKLGHQYENWVKCDQNSRQPTYFKEIGSPV